MTQSIQIYCKDNIKLSATLYQPQGQVKAGIIINSATAVKQSYYANFAQYLSQQGFLVVTYDYRGIGLSKLGEGLDNVFTMQQWGEYDLAAVIDWSTEQYPQLKWHCLGHSVGGQIIGFAANNTELSSVLCISSQSGYWGHWRKLLKTRMFATWHLLIPLLVKLTGQIPGRFIGGEDLPGGIAKQWAYWGRHKDYIVDDEAQPIRKGFEQVTCDMKFIIIADDEQFAPASAVKALASFYQHADVRLETIEAKQANLKAIGHFGYFKQRQDPSLWNIAVDWLTRH